MVTSPQSNITVLYSLVSLRSCSREQQGLCYSLEVGIEIGANGNVTPIVDEEWRFYVTAVTQSAQYLAQHTLTIRCQGFRRCIFTHIGVVLHRKAPSP
jgi:hypothetical protein